MAASTPPGRKVVREATRLEKCNKTEARFHREVLLRAPGRLVILPQPPRFFELKGGGTYTPDFLALPEGGPVHVFEVKAATAAPDGSRASSATGAPPSNGTAAASASSWPPGTRRTGSGASTPGTAAGNGRRAAAACHAVRLRYSRCRTNPPRPRCKKRTQAKER